MPEFDFCDSSFLMIDFCDSSASEKVMASRAEGRVRRWCPVYHGAFSGILHYLQEL
jgi:hypothetical protein